MHSRLLALALDFTHLRGRVSRLPEQSSKTHGLGFCTKTQDYVALTTVLLEKGCSPLEPYLSRELEPQRSGRGSRLPGFVLA